MKYHQPRILLSFLVFAGLWLALPFSAQYAQTSKAKKQTKAATLRSLAAAPALTAAPEQHDAHTGDFVIVRTENGTECRPLTLREEQEWRFAERRVELHALAGSLQQRTQQSFKIMLRGTTQLENAPQAKEAFIRAAAKWEAIIRSNITVLLDVDYGTTRFGVPYPSPNIIGSTGAQQLLDDAETGYKDIREAMLTVSNSPAQTSVIALLPANSLPTDLGNTGFASAPSANYRALGLLNAVPNETAERQQGLGNPPSIGFNSALTFDFDPSDGIDPGALDFEAAAVHEIGHALGFISFMGTKELSLSAPVAPTPWDIFRFRPGGLVLNSLSNGQRVQVAGGTQVFFAGGEEYGLATGTPAGTNGDGNQGSHWKADEQTGQYIGIMDPTGSSGERSDLTAADLNALTYFGYQINTNVQVHELLAVSDNTREESQDRSNALVVNRYTPPRYPAKLEFFRVLIPPAADGSPQAGQTLRIFGFADPNRTGQPPANPTLLFERTVTINQLPNNRVLAVQIPNGPTINSGDLYLGVQTNSATIPIAVDLTGTQRGRSFISTNNGQSFQPLMTQNLPTPAPVNFMARAYMSMPYGNATAPGDLTLSPSAVAPGSPAFTLFVFGSNFQANSVVRVNGSDRPTSYQSGTLLQAQIPASDVANAGTLKVTVFTPGPGGGETVMADLIVSANNSVPILTRLDPPGGPSGASSLTLNVFGTNFNAQSRIRVNDNERQTTLVNSTQVSTMLTQAELANALNLIITVANPGPGGGTSNALSFAVTACNVTFSLSNPATFASRSAVAASGVIASGFVLSANSSVCPWTATVSEPWINFTGPTSGLGRSVINFGIQPQPDAGLAPREAQLTAGNRTVTIRQVGRAASASAASFTAASFAAEQIVALFGNGLARETRTADTTPLPTSLATTRVIVQDASGAQRLASLFFVSSGQINFLVPAGTANGSALVLVEVDGQFYADSRITVTPTAPGFFAANSNGQGVPAAVLLRIKADGSQSFEPVAELNPMTNRYVPKPIDFLNETDRLVLVLFGTGIRGRASLNAVTLKLAELDVPAQFAGSQGDLVGLDQVNLELPRSLRGRGTVTLAGTVDGRAINPLMVAFQ